MIMQKKETSSPQQSIERALKLLTLMGESRTAMNVTEISRALNISRSTAYAMLHVMTDLNFLARDPVTGKYFLGYAIFLLGSQSRVRYSHILPCDDYLDTFAQQISLPVTCINIWVLEQDYQILRFLTKRPGSPRSPLVQFTEKRLMPSFCTASGKLLLSELEQEEQEKALAAQNLCAYTPATITDPARILEELVQTRRQGYGIDIEGYSNFEVNVAAPVRDYSGKAVGAVNMCVSKLLYLNRSQEYIQMTVALGKELSSVLGYKNNNV